jgi:carboxyl-terminal processing protease
MSQLIRYATCILLGLTLGLSVTLSGQENARPYSADYSYPLLLDVLETVETYYVQKVPKEELIQAAINGIFDRLDPYSSFLDQQDLSNLREANKGEYFGFGFEIASDDGKISIIAPLPNSPAENAGIRPGDRILSLNGIDITSLNLATVLQDIKSHSVNNQAISLLMQHDNSDIPFEVTLTPAVISVNSVSGHMLEHQIGYIRLTSFQENSTEDMVKLLMQWPPSQLKGIILDLRNNPGGLLDQAIKIADLFLAKGRIVTTSGRFFDANSDYYASPQTVVGNVPMLVLINKGSASASEVLAAALQDNNRAKLLGETSFGKGTVQSLIPTLMNGNAIKLTIAKYSTPKGVDIHSKGIEPDIKFSPETVTDTPNVAIIDPAAVEAGRAQASHAEDKALNSAIAWISTQH